MSMPTRGALTGWRIWTAAATDPPIAPIGAVWGILRLTWSRLAPGSHAGCVRAGAYGSTGSRSFCQCRRPTGYANSTSSHPRETRASASSSSACLPPPTCSSSLLAGGRRQATRAPSSCPDGVRSNGTAAPLGNEPLCVTAGATS